MDKKVVENFIRGPFLWKIVHLTLLEDLNFHVAKIVA